MKKIIKYKLAKKHKKEIKDILLILKVSNSFY